jgi:hypothetical protein
LNQSRLARVVVTMALVAVISACKKGDATDDGFRRVQLDMTESQVVEILGTPDKAWTHPQNASLRMLEWKGDSRVVLVDGR